MSSAPLAAPMAPIRQPRGPPSDSPSQAFSPPEADQDSLRRANTFSTPRHHPSSSISSSQAGSTAFHGRYGSGGNGTGGGRFKVMSRQFRSGSLSSSGQPSGLVRTGSGREGVRTEEVVVEDQALEDGDEEVTTPGTGNENDYYAKGLSRQSSLPSRRCKLIPPGAARYEYELTFIVVNPVLSRSGQLQDPSKGLMGPPPRPPRRIQVPDMSDPISPPPPSSSHTVSHSLSSLQMISPPAHRISLEEQSGHGHVRGAASVSRTQSLRAQAKHAETSGLGRSSSLRTPGEVGFLEAKML